MKYKIIVKKKIPIKHHDILTTQTTTPPSRERDIEEFISDTLNLLFEGMTRGNQVDKKAAESLIASIRYKTSREFYIACLTAYEEALKLHEEVFVDAIVNKITNNISKLMDQGKEVLKKITQKILLPSPPSPNDEIKQ